jgi:hypothetical protein
LSPMPKVAVSIQQISCPRYLDAYAIELQPAGQQPSMDTSCQPSKFFSI